jgi:hypothetical protein
MHAWVVIKEQTSMQAIIQVLKVNEMRTGSNGLAPLPWTVDDLILKPVR